MRKTVENISLSISMKECLRPQWRSNLWLLITSQMGIWLSHGGRLYHNIKISMKLFFFMRLQNYEIVLDYLTMFCVQKLHVLFCKCNVIPYILKQTQQYHDRLCNCLTVIRCLTQRMFELLTPNTRIFKWSNINYMIHRCRHKVYNMFTLT